MRCFASTITMLALCVACQSAPDWQRTDSNDVQNSLLAYVPKSEQHAIEQARQERGAIAEQFAAAERDRDAAKSRLDLANDDLSVVQMRLREAKNQVDHARQYGDQSEYEKAKHNVDDAEAAVRLARAKVAYYQDLCSFADSRVQLLQKRGQLANAVFDLTKADAVSKLDRPVAKQVDVEKRRESVHRLQDDVQRAANEAKVARLRAKLQADTVGERRDDVPEAFRMNAIASVDEVFSAQPFDGLKDQLAQATDAASMTRAQKPNGEAKAPNGSEPAEASSSEPSTPSH